MEEDEVDFSSLMPQLKGNKKFKKKSGGFQSMGLSHSVLRAVLKKGYKVPTPIQRKAIPAIMKGKNVTAMARTGSGKTAAFLIPMLEKLKCRIAKAGARALIFSPTRELAIQTMKFTKELSCNTDLKAVLVLGGEKIEDQFAAIHESPDIIIATPGRFLHVVVEMNLKLSSVEYVVLDEADRLFEMKFQEQLQEVLNRLPSERQTLLFSATLPKILFNFVKEFVEDPELIRLDVDLQISKNLKSTFLLCRENDKAAMLLHMLQNIVDLSKELTVVFLPTKHHVEYMKDILEKAGIPCSYVYSGLDQMARKIHIDKFRARKVAVLLGTDIAARGIDIPLLDSVINYNFPATPKLYVHRVGRVARAGRSGQAISLVSHSETPFLLDLHLFLGKPVKFSSANMEDEDSVCGSIPRSIFENEAGLLQSWHRSSVDLANMLKVTQNAYKNYIKSMTAPSTESIKRMKAIQFTDVEIHPKFQNKDELERSKILRSIRNYRPNTTIFELGNLAKTCGHVMRAKRKVHDMIIQRRREREKTNSTQVKEEVHLEREVIESTSENDIKSFLQNSKKEKSERKKVTNYRDPEYYISSVPSGHYREKGLGLENNFVRQAADAVIDFTGDDGNISKSKNSTHWDRKKKKFVHNDNNEKSKKMKTESGVWIPKSYKSDVYKKWQEKNKVKYRDGNEDDDDGQLGKQKGLPRHMKNKWKGKQNTGGRPMRREMKNKEEILKARNRREKFMSQQKKKQKLKTQKNYRKN